MLLLQSDRAKNVADCPMVRDMCVHAHIHSSVREMSLNFIRDIWQWEGIRSVRGRNDPSKKVNKKLK